MSVRTERYQELPEASELIVLPNADISLLSFLYNPVNSHRSERERSKF